MIRRFFLKLRRRRQMAADLEAELAFHRDMAANSGNPAPFGNPSVIREQAFDLWRFNFVENLWRDLAYALRTLRKSPGFVLTALLSLALGIGVNTTMFSLAVGFLLGIPSVREPNQVAYVRWDRNSHITEAQVDVLNRSGAFQGVTGENTESFVNFNDGSETRRIFGLQGTMNYFEVLGVPVSLGRGWTSQDPREVAVLHPRFWRTRLGGDPAIIGKTLRLDGRLYTVLGVLSEDYRSLTGFGLTPDVLVPRYVDATILQAYARLKPDMGIGQCNAAMPALTASLRDTFPKESDRPNATLSCRPVVGSEIIRSERQALTIVMFFGILLLIVGLVLLIACVNVAGLLLARASTRQREIATRLALGASRGRLLQQLLSESLLLSLTGALLGLGFAFVAARFAENIPLPLPVPIRLQIAPDWRVMSYAAALAIIATLASGLMPAWQTVRESLTASMHRERRLRMRRALVIAQIAVSFIVLTTAALFLHNLLRSTAIGPGFDVHHNVRAEVHLPPNVYRDATTITPFVDRAVEAVRAVPGVQVAAAARIVPFTNATNFGSDFRFDGQGQDTRVQFNWNAVSADFFDAMQIPILQGRPFAASDRGSRKVVIVNDTFVKQYLPGKPAVGTSFLWSGSKDQYEIVGVVKTTKNITLGEDDRAQLYEPLPQIKEARPRIELIARTAMSPALLVPSVRQAVRGVEPAAGVEVQTMFSAIGLAFLPSQVGAILMGSAGALGLLLAVIGLYGVLAYTVARRTREIGIRVAIGASARDVSVLVLRDFGMLLVWGIGIGLAVALFVTRPLAMFFVAGLSPTDPYSFGAVIAALALTGMLAAVGPVRRALAVDPARCLRWE